MGGIFEFLGSLATIVKTWFVGENSPEEVANKEAANKQAVKTKVEGDIAKGDSAAVGKDIS